MFAIEYLADHKEYVDTVTNWACNEWGSPNNFAFYESIIKHSLDKDKLPLTFVAFLDGEMVGTVGLWRCDLMSRQDLFPWLSALYVKENCRGKGIGQALQQFLIQYAKGQGFERLYLFTDINNYYEKTGWEYLEDGVEYSGEKIKIYTQGIKDII